MLHCVAFSFVCGAWSVALMLIVFLFLRVCFGGIGGMTPGSFFLLHVCSLLVSRGLDLLLSPTLFVFLTTVGDVGARSSVKHM